MSVVAFQKKHFVSKLCYQLKHDKLYVYNAVVQ